VGVGGGHLSTQLAQPNPSGNHSDRPVWRSRGERGWGEGHHASDIVSDAETDQPLPVLRLWLQLLASALYHGCEFVGRQGVILFLCRLHSTCTLIAISPILP